MNPENDAGDETMGVKVPSTNPVDQFEETFMNCFSSLVKEDTLTNVDREEIKVDVEQGITGVIDAARHMECYFLKKRLQIAAEKPELIVKDDCTELRNELVRKDELMKKNFEKINYWLSILAEVQSSSGSGPPGAKNTMNMTPPGPGGMPSTPNPGTSSIASPGVAPGSQNVASPLTPMSGRPHTPGGGRPLTPGSGNPPSMGGGMGPMGRGQPGVSR